CDVLVGLIGHYRGWEPPGDNASRSITEMEYDWAVERGLERLMYVLPDGVLTTPAMTPDEAARQLVFRERVLGNEVHDLLVHKGEFVEPGHLAAAVGTGLLNLFYARMLTGVAEATDEGEAGLPADATPAPPSPAAALA